MRPTHGVDAPLPRTMKTNVKKNKAVENSHLAVIQHGPETPTRVCLEVCHRHLSARNESRESREQTERDENAAGELDQTCHQTFWVVNLTLTVEHAEQLLRPVARKQKTGDAAKNRVGLSGMAMEKRIHKPNEMEISHGRVSW